MHLPARASVTLALVLVAACIGAGLLAARDSQAILLPPKQYIVDTTAADPDGTMNGCDFPNVTVDCSLVGAINDANAHTGTLSADSITFSVLSGGHGGEATIHPTTQLPDITDPVDLDGATQPNFDDDGDCIGDNVTPCVFIDGPGSNTAVSGLVIESGGVTIRGIHLGDFDTAVKIVSGSNETLERNLIGSDQNVLTTPNVTGIIIAGGVTNVTIGGTSDDQRNFLSGNSAQAVLSSGDEVTIQGNYIGTNPAGTSSVGNSTGLELLGAENTVGGSTAGAGNLISGNDGAGIQLLSTTQALIEGNLIGTDASGASPLRNGYGITTYLDQYTTIGGTDPGTANVIAGNSQDGLNLEPYYATIEGNFIGTNSAGTSGIGNGGNGVAVIVGQATVGGTDAAARNVISGNGDDGIIFDGVNDGGIFGNYIGTTPNGDSALANSGNGIEIKSDSLNRSEDFPISGNVISGNGVNGIAATGENNGEIDFIPITGNIIGLNAAGTAKVPNLADGLFLDAEGSNSIHDITIGGPDTSDANVLSGNGQAGPSEGGYGIKFNGDVHGSTVQGNFIGTNAASATGLGNSHAGVLLVNATGNLFEGNTIGENGGAGVSDHASDNAFQNNFIGTNSDGKALANGGSGVFISGDSNVVGGETEATPAGVAVTATPGPGGKGNVIAHNGGSGVEIEFGDQNLISENSIDSDDSLGIAFDDVGDNNGGATPPVIALATSGGGSTHVTGTLTSTGASPFTIEFFSSPACDSSGSGEGRVFLGSATVSTVAGVAAISATVANEAGVGNVVTATATDSANNTSQFSNCVTVTAGSASTTPSPSPTPVHTPTPTPSAAPRKGDANCDGSVNVFDVVEVLSQAAGLSTAPCAANANTDCDGDVDGMDALRILDFFVGDPLPQPSGCSAIG